MSATNTDQPIRLLHLSDLHFKAGTAWDADPLLRALCGFIEQEVADGLVPDLVAITGDIAFAGLAKEYALARKGLDNLWPKLGGLAPERLLLVPGNHDVDRAKGGFLAEAVQEKLLSGGDQRQIAIVLSESPEREILLQRQAAYLAFYADWLGAPQAQPWWQRTIALRGTKLHIAGLDSAWMACGDEDRGRLLLGRYQLTQTVETDEAEGAGWRIALMHHPWDYLAEFDSHPSRAVVHQSCDLLLRGHLHRRAPERVVPPDPSRGCLELAAGCVYNNSEYPNAFQWIELLPAKRVRVLFRAWLHDAWTVDRNQPGCPEGRAEFDLGAQPATPKGKRDEPPPADFRKYLQDLWEETALIDIRGLFTGRPEAKRFPIEDLYIELSASGGMTEEGEPRRPAERGDALLKAALQNPHLVIIGDPGCGKTTFLRWVAHCLAGDRLGRTPGAAGQHLGLDRARLPVLVPIAGWLHFVECCKAQNKGPALPQGAEWLVAYLDERATDANQGLAAGDFRRALKEGDCALLLDGLDEAPDDQQRQRARGLIEMLGRAYPDCAVVVTSRPAAYQDKAVLAGFTHSHIEALDAAAIDGFLARWSRALFPESENRAERHRKELAAALASRRDIWVMARNTVMLTALAVVHWYEKRLPEQRAELYESILKWLLEAREQRPGREKSQRCRQLLADLALAMQTNPGGRQVQVTRRWAAARLAPRFGADAEATARAEAFLAEEEIDSGIIVRRGHQLRFWLLTFQEHLAAWALAGWEDGKRTDLLLDSTGQETPPLYRPEWRETVLLLAGVLHLQDQDRVDGLVAAMLDRLGTRPSLPKQARAAGLLGAVVQDLSPFAYRPADPRYTALLDAAMAVFDARQAAAIPLQDRIAAADALARAGDPRLGWTAPGRWVALPGGTFAMGAQKTDPNTPGHDPEAADDEAPVHTVVVDPYQIGRFPVTVAEYAEFVDDKDAADPRWWQAGGGDKGAMPANWEEQQAHPSRPMAVISWHQAMAFCAWLTDRLGRPQGAKGEVLLPAGCVARLPTEAEWEFAARGSDGRRYPWGNQRPDADRANFEYNVGDATPVGILPVGTTPDGVVDMAGNVFEWCLDAYDEGFYAGFAKQGTARNPVAAGDAGVPRVLRGGAFDVEVTSLRTSARFRCSPGSGNGNVGFRCVVGQPRDERTIAELQAWELLELGRDGRFAAAANLQGQWLSNLENADPLLLGLRDVARYLLAADNAIAPYHRLQHLDTAGRTLATVRRQQRLLAARSPLARCLVPVLATWGAALGKRRRDAKALAARQLPNPFFAGEPLTPDQGWEVFRGRTQLLHQLEAILGDPEKSISVALIGPRRCGKTSLLRMLPKLLPDTVVVFFDLQDNPVETPEAFFSSLEREAWEQAQRNHARELPRLPGGPPIEAGSHWFRQLDTCIGEGRILLCIDEFERLETLFPPDARGLVQLLGLFRATIQHRRHLRLLVAGAAPFGELGALWNDNFISVRELRIGHLKRADALDLLTRPSKKFPNDAISRPVADKVFERTGGQPYLLQLYGSLLITHLNAMGRRSATADDVRQIEREVLSQGTYYFRNLYQSAPEAARDVLRALANDKTPTPDRQTKEWLYRRGLLRGQRIGIPVFKTWIIEEDGL